ncbi:hypothetical protein DFH28DRAFT_1194660 [Melampsora americana]|nr:hypothetical protein DFH28DRAFT_1194660 [Melampsora americana]
MSAQVQVCKVIKEIAKVERCKFQNNRLRGTIFHIQPKDETVPGKSAMKPKPDQSIWDSVDKRLSWVKNLTAKHQILFYQWIMHYDSKTFTGKEDIQEIKKWVKIVIITPYKFAK